LTHALSYIFPPYPHGPKGHEDKEGLLFLFPIQHKKPQIRSATPPLAEARSGLRPYGT
jgi:hypothetical protein